MPHYSTFWDRHYKDIGNCCMTQPLDDPISINDTDAAGGVYTSRYIEMIDVGWMKKKKLKWIGWDKHGRTAWITPGGMIFNFKDLPRNEKGKQWEKEEGKMKLFYDTQMPSFIRDAPQGVYNKELDMQSECRLCHDKKVKDLPDDDDDSMGTGEGEDRTTNNDWQQYADGRAPELKDVTETDYVSEAKKYAGVPEDYQYKNEYISPLPVAPPVPLPASPTTYAPTPVGLQPYTYKFTPPPANPVARQKVTNHLEDVLTPAPSPYQKMKSNLPGRKTEPVEIDNLRVNRGFIPDEEYIFPEQNNNQENPFKAVGTFGVTPTNNSKNAKLSSIEGQPNQNPFSKKKSTLYTTPNGARTHTVEEWAKHYQGKSQQQVANDKKPQYYHGVRAEGGPSDDWRYVILESGKILDMRHVVIVGIEYGTKLGTIIEIGQNFTDRASANSKQDYFSNKIGEEFLEYLKKKSPYYNPKHSTKNYGNIFEKNFSMYFKDFIESKNW